MARRARLIITREREKSWGGPLIRPYKALLRPIFGTTLGAFLGILGFILEVLGGAQSALDYKEALKGHIRPLRAL